MTESLRSLLQSVNETLRERWPATDSDRVSSGRLVLNEGHDYRDGTLFLEKGDGAYVIDTQGNRYIDFALGAGTHILGHGPATVVQAVDRQMRSGSLFVRPSLVSHRYAELLASLQPRPKRFAFCNSGAEATLRAMRAARGFSGKNKIAIWPGGWHGSHDWGLFEEDPTSDANHPGLFPRSAGVPTDLAQHLTLLPASGDAAVEFIADHADELAMVLIEPLRGTLPIPESAEILPALREVTRRFGILLGFDEVVTGFRLALGGGQARYGVEADIVVYGKIAGGGLPLGVMGLTEPIADAISANADNPRDIVYFGGTFSANPLCVSSGLAAVDALTRDAGTIYPRLDALTDRFVKRMNAHFIQSEIAMRCAGVSGIFRFLFTNQELRSRRDRDTLEAPREIQDLFYNLLLMDGIHIGTNRVMFLSTKHDDGHIDALESACIRACRKLRDAGILEA
jgi:glutamate-1-semialdehyde aminotransferase